MKTIYIKLLIVFVIIINTTSCKSQTLPYNTLMENIPSGAYVKDLNNELAP